VDFAWLLALAFFAGAVLYASVGHAGASGYLAAMAFAGMPAATMRPTALVLNLLVASFAYVGGGITLPGHWYRALVGLVLWVAALRLWLNLSVHRQEREPPRVVAMLCGAGIGLLAGLTGTGGGIFLSPLLLFLRWAETRQTGGVAAAFILLNSLAGLAGNPASLSQLPSHMPLWAAAVGIGGLVGAEIGSRRIGTPAFRRVLGVVLLVAGAKLVFSS
jgi:uncharacterized membrane protein YfcA